MRGLRSAATRARRKKKLPDHETDAQGMVWESRRRKRKKNPAAAVGAAESRRRSHKRKSPKRVAAGRKAARTRKRRGTSYKRKRPGHRKHRVRAHSYRRRGKRIRVRGHMSHEETKRHRRRNPRRRRRNPIDGWKEMLSGVFGVAAGYVLASGGDRFIQTHALNAAGQDAPAAGQIYNSESLLLPIWSSWGRLGVAAASIGVPLFVASKVKSAAWKSFFQLAGFGALARTAGKAADDGLGALAAQTVNPMLVQLYSPELAAQAAVSRLANGAPATLPGTFAGLRRLLGIGRVGNVVAAGTDEDGQQTCPQGYSLGDDGNCYSPPDSPPTPVPPSPTPVPPSPTCPPPTQVFVPVPTPVPTPVPSPCPTVPTSGPSNPVIFNPAVSVDRNAPFSPLLCTPEPDPC